MATKDKTEEGLSWSLNLVKPEAVQRGLIGRIISRFEDKGLRLVGLKMVWPSRELIEANYSDNAEETWFPKLVDYMTSGPVIAMVWEGPNANQAARQIIGKKDPMKSDAGTMRGDFNIEMVKTVVHGSRTPEEAEREIGLWFFGKGPKPTWDCILGTEGMEPEHGGEGAVATTAEAEKKQPVMPSQPIHAIDPTKRSDEGK